MVLGRYPGTLYVGTWTGKALQKDDFANRQTLLEASGNDTCKAPRALWQIFGFEM